MYENLKGLGITTPDEVEHYSLRQDAENDVLKVYFKRHKGSLFAKSVKFEYPRQHKKLIVDSGTHKYQDITEINTNLSYVVEELDQITQHHQYEADIKKKIIADLRHLEKSVSKQIAQIEADLERYSVK